jgi:hypothetical protein
MLDYAARGCNRGPTLPFFDFGAFHDPVSFSIHYSIIYRKTFLWRTQLASRIPIQSNRHLP